MNLKETYNLIAKDWHQDHKEDDWWLEGTDKFISFMKPGALVLDAGCGGGTKSKYLANKELQVIGVDFSEKQIDIAKKEAPTATFLVCDLKDIDKLNYQFDGVFAQAVLLHFPKKEIDSILTKFSSRLKDAGYLYVAVKEQKPGVAEEEVKTDDNYGYPYERFFSYFKRDEVESFIKNAGFEIVYSNVETSGKTNWIQVIGRKLL